MTVLLVDDHPLFRSGLRLLLSDLDPSLTFAEADGVRGALAFIDEPVDLILLDLQAGRAAGLRALATLRDAYVDARIVALCSDSSIELVDNCLAAGACGFVCKAARPVELIAALRRVADRGISLPLSLDDGLATAPPSLDGVDAVDLDLFWMTLQGRPAPAIRGALGLSDEQIALRLAAVYRRLGVDGRVQALWSMAQIGLCCPVQSEPLTLGA